MQINYDKNKTMFLLGKQSSGSGELEAVRNIIDGLGLPYTSENILLVHHGLQYGRILGKREVRKKKLS